MILKTKHGKTLGPLGYYFNLKMELKFNEFSSVSFDIPAQINGKTTPHYKDIVGGKLVQIDPYGVFVLNNPSTTGDGIREIKSCTAYSLEYELAGKQITFGEGTYPLYQPVASGDSIMGMALETTRHWKIGSVPASLWSRYRTFSQTDTKLLDFLLNDVQKSFGCLFVFDTYTRTINVVDAEDQAAMLPIYLSYHNLIKEVEVNEVDDNMATRIFVSGADGVSIRNVNPTGNNTMIDLGYHISNGDIPPEVADRYRDWQNELTAQQAYYTSLVAMRNMTYARYQTEKARLTDLEGELASLDNLRSVNTQGRAMAHESGPETVEGTVAYFDKRLEAISIEYRAKEAEIEAQKQLLEDLLAEYDAAGDDVTAVNDGLRMERYFTSDEMDILAHYISDGIFEDSTFATFDVDISGKNDSFVKGERATVRFEDTTVVDIEMTNVWECQSCTHNFKYTGTPTVCPNCGGTSLKLKSGADRRILAFTGGTVNISGEDYHLEGDLISATLDQKGIDVVCSMYLGSGVINGSDFPSGNLSCVCTSSLNIDDFLGGMEKIVEVVEDADHTVQREDVSYKGAGSISTTNSAFYFTRNVTEYQHYSVEKELYDHAEKCLEELAYPTYEFNVKSGNLIWDKKFEPFKNALRLGCGVYLQLDDETLLKPMLLEVHLDFEQPGNFDLIFSNEFQVKRPDKVNWLKELLAKASSSSRTLDLEKYKFGNYSTSGASSAVENFIREGLNAALQQIVAGREQCVSITAAGIKISSPDSSDYISINNGMIALVDANGNTAKMALGHFYNQASGQDYYGILADLIGGVLIAGQNLIIECPDPNGGIMQFKVDSSGVIVNNGRIYMQSDKGGKIGFDAHYGLFAGTSSLFDTTDTGYVHPSFIDENGNLVLDRDKFPQGVNVWIGIDGQAYFRGNIYAQDGVFNGMIYAKGGEFTGTLKATTLDGRLVGSTNGAIEGVSLNIGDGNFTVDQNGNVVIKKGSISWGAVIGTEEIDQRIQAAQDAADEAYDEAYTAVNDVLKLAKGTYTKGTFINGTTVSAPEIIGGNIYGVNIYAGEGNGSYAHMANDGFHIYVDDISMPKAELVSVRNGAQVQLALGSGGGSSPETHDRLYLIKYEGSAQLVYFTQSGKSVGFGFNNDGSISVAGNLKVNAVFG